MISCSESKARIALPSHKIYLEVNWSRNINSEKTAINRKGLIIQISIPGTTIH